MEVIACSCPGISRNLRPAAGSDQDVFRGEALTVDLDLMRADDLRVRLVQGHAAVDQQVAINAVEAIDLAVLVGDQGRPVEIRFTQAPAETGRLLEVFSKMRAVHQQFLRHTADVDAGATQVTTLGHRHFRAETGSKARRAYTAGTGTNHIKVKIVGHFYLLGRPSAYPQRSIGQALCAAFSLTGDSGKHLQIIIFLV